MFHVGGKKPRIAQNSPLIKTLKNEKNLKAKKSTYTITQLQKKPHQGTKGPKTNHTF
jgi:hypothetical protein